ncbi:MAG: hypothetical protein JW959_00775 [Pirellulales bacterium]|nr:hypothetical protein [Pirellulales bacterium]
MTTVFIVCAAVGGSVLVIQFVLALIGLGGEAFDLDVSGDVDDFGGDIAGDFDADLGGDIDGDFQGETHPLDHLDVPDGGDHVGSTWLFGVISFRTVVAALAFFGLVGLYAESVGASQTNSLLMAVAAGVAAMMSVYWLMLGLRKLQADGSVRVHRAVGRHGSVYLRVPGEKAGTGKIQFNLQNRTMEYLAVTAGPELPTGAKVVVVGIVNPNTLEVQADNP